MLGVVLLAIWVTLAFTKLHALIFVAIVMMVGLSARELTKWLQRRRGSKLSLLQQAVQEQLPADALARPRILIGTYGSDALAAVALREAKRRGAVVVVCFIREVALSYKYEGPLTIETDLAAQRAFSRFLELGHQA